MTVTRTATAPDLVRLADLDQRDAAWTSYVSSRLHRRDSIVLVAEQDDCLAGYLAAQVVQRGQPTGDGWLKGIARAFFCSTNANPESIIQPLPIGIIDDVYVAAAYHRHGIATDLVRHCAEWLQNRQVNEIQVTIEANNNDAQDFFHQLGFEPARVLMRKRLGQQQQISTSYVRPATRPDLPSLADLLRREVECQQKLAACFQLVPRVDWTRYVSAKLRHKATQILVAAPGGNLVGFIELRLVPSGQRGAVSQLKALARRFLGISRQKPQPYGFIEDVYVLPTWRKQGLATALVEQSSQWLQSRQAAEVQAAIWQANEISLRFFRQLGFEPIRLMLNKRLNGPG